MLEYLSDGIGFLGGSDGKESSVQETWVRPLGQGDPLRREWQPTPVALPGEFHGQEPGRLQYIGLQSQAQLSDYRFHFSNAVEGGMWP